VKHKLIGNVLLAAALAAGIAMAKSTAPELTGDAGIAQKAAHEVRSYAYYSLFDDVKIQVNNGTVQLTGEVTQPWKKDTLGKLIGSINGVTAVHNELKVAPLSAFDDRIRLQVARAIFRDPTMSMYAIQPVPPIHILVDNGHVTLEGVVRTPMEKEIAGIRANSAMSFGMVTNNLRVEQPAKQN
jgi:osmotically-inducible protein OsmY